MVLKMIERSTKRNIYEVNNTCNLRCKYCPVVKGSKQLPLVEIIRRTSNTRYDYLGISGGEPLLHPNISDIIRHFSEIADVVALSTNGTVKPNFGYTKNLGVQVSIPSLNPEVFAMVTGAGNSDKIISDIKTNLYLLKEIGGLGIKIKTVLCDINSEEKSILELIEFARDMGIGIVFYPAVITKEDSIDLVSIKTLRALREVITPLILSNAKEDVTLVSPHDIRTMIELNHMYENYIRLDGSKYSSLFHAYCV